MLTSLNVSKPVTNFSEECLCTAHGEVHCHAATCEKPLFRKGNLFLNYRLNPGHTPWSLIHVTHPLPLTLFRGLPMMWFYLKLGFRAFFGISRKNWDGRQNMWISGARGHLKSPKKCPEIHKNSQNPDFCKIPIQWFLDLVDLVRHRKKVH